MLKLLELLEDGNTRTFEQLANELDTTKEDVVRQLEFLVRLGAVREVPFIPDSASCGTCAGCNSCEGSCAAACKGCIPKNATVNMGRMWEVV